MLSHNELALLLFALQGADAAPAPDQEACEDECPVVESVEELLCGGKLDPERQLVRHLNQHMREALIESGLFELMARDRDGNGGALAIDRQAELQMANRRLALWSSDIQLTQDERKLLVEAFGRIPRSAWLTMPRALWRLKRKLK